MAKCTVCGGEIDGARCSSCGMAQGTSGNQNSYSNDNKYYQNQSSTTMSQNHSGGFGAQKKKKSPITKMIVLFIAFFLFAAVLGIVNTLNSASVSVLEQIGDTDDFFQDNIIEFEEDDSVEEKEQIILSDDEYMAYLSSGAYVVGVHIPAGVYEIGYVSEEDYTWGYVEVMRDGSYEIYGSVDEVKEVELIEGDGINLEVDEKAYFYCENPQEFTGERVLNSLTQTILVEDNDALIAGIDFPAGTYDIYIIENDYGSIDVDIYDDFSGNQNSHYWFDYGQNINDEPIRHIEFPTGTKVEVEDATVELVPSKYDTLLAFFSFEENYVELNKAVEEKVIAENYQRQSEDKPIEIQGSDKFKD